MYNIIQVCMDTVVQYYLGFEEINRWMQKVNFHRDGSKSYVLTF